MTVPVRHGAVVTAGDHLEMSSASLGMSDGHLKSWHLCVFFFFFEDIRTGLCSRSLYLLLGEGLRSSAEGQTSSQEFGDAVM